MTSMSTEEWIRRALEQLTEGVGEVSNTLAGVSVKQSQQEQDIQRILRAIDGNEGADGLRTRMRILEAEVEKLAESAARSAEDARREEQSGAHDALVTIEQARAEAAKQKWSAVLAVLKAVGPTLAAVGTAIGAHIAWK